MCLSIEHFKYTFARKVPNFSFAQIAPTSKSTVDALTLQKGTMMLSLVKKQEKFTVASMKASRVLQAWRKMLGDSTTNGLPSPTSHALLFWIIFTESVLELF